MLSSVEHQKSFIYNLRAWFRKQVAFTTTPQKVLKKVKLGIQVMSFLQTLQKNEHHSNIEVFAKTK